MLKKIYLITLLLLSSSAFLFAQNTKYSKDYRFFNRKYTKPSIEVSYGISNIRLNGDNNGLADAGMIELKLGFSSQIKSNYGINIIKYDNAFIFLRNASSDSYSNSNNPGTSSSLWSFGLGNKEGFGVKLGTVSLIPYNSNSLAWSELSYPVSEESSAENSALADFNNAFRFGTTTEAGIILQITPGFSIQPEYEISDIFPRHLFGKQLMSSVIELGGLYLIGDFTKLIMRNTPVAGTFVNFILKNAYEYGFYQLRKNQMYWPFTSVAPLRYNTFKLGMTFTF